MKTTTRAATFVGLLCALLFALPLLAGGSAVYAPLVLGMPTPTLMPTLTPTPLPQGEVVILPNHSSFYRFAYYSVFVGEVQNNTDRTIGAISFKVEVLSDGVVVEERSAQLGLAYLLPGDRTCFIAYAGKRPEEWDEYRFVGLDAQPANFQVVQYTVHNSHGEPWNRDYRVSVGLQNQTGVNPSPNGRLAVTLYDAAGMVLECKRETPIGIGPGGASNYAVYLYEREEYGGVVSHRAQANAPAAR